MVQYPRMRKISLYILIVTLAGSAFVGVWAYQRYFREEQPQYLAFKVERGDLQEMIKVRGEVVAQKTFDLSFSAPGIVDRIFVEEGQTARAGAALMKLDTAGLESDARRLRAERSRARAGLEGVESRLLQFIAARDAQAARLEELKRGARPEEIGVREAEAVSARVAADSAKNGLIEAIRDAYTKADEAIRDKADQAFINPRSDNPQLRFSVNDAGLETEALDRRRSVESMLVAWEAALGGLSPSGDPEAPYSEAKDDLGEARDFLDNLALALSGAISGSGASQASIDAWKTSVSTARTAIGSAIGNLTEARDTWRVAEAHAAVAESELALLKAGTSAEQLAAQQALVRQAEANIATQAAAVKEAESTILSLDAQVDAVKDRISKATIISPAEGVIAKVWLEKGEVVQPGQAAVSLETQGHKIQADISELDIGKVRASDGNSVSIVFDAIPEKAYSGQVVSIEPREVVKEGDKYYRTDIFLEKHGDEIRAGMSADLTIIVSEKSGVLKIPRFAVYEREGRQYVLVGGTGGPRETEIRTGIHDDDSIEATDGLAEGQIVLVVSE